MPSNCIHFLYRLLFLTSLSALIAKSFVSQLLAIAPAPLEVVVILLPKTTPHTDLIFSCLAAMIIM